MVRRGVRSVTRGRIATASRAAARRARSAARTCAAVGALPLLLLFVACDKPAPTPGNDTATVPPPPPQAGVTPPPAVDTPWDSAGGAVFLAIGPNATTAAVIFPGLASDAEVESSKLDAQPYRGSAFGGADPKGVLRGALENEGVWSDRRVAQALASFPALAERLDEPAGNLSGGQQQMLGLAMNLIAAPSLLLIDELSLGLAPVVVERLVELVREVAAEGTTVILLEQSVNVALTLADRAYFLEKGQVRFSGPTADLLDRPDLLRSVFLGRAVEAATSVTPAPPATGAARTAAAADGAAARGTAAAIPVALEAVGVTCTFGGVRAVDSVDLRVARGEIVGLIGPNGAGKTTLLDALCGYVSIDRGEVCLEGRTITAMSPDARARRGLGRSFQDAALFGSLTVGEALAASLHRHVAVHDVFNPILRMPVSVAAEAWVRSRVDELLDLFALDALADLRVGELSTGSRRIVDLAASVALSPSVLLLDEPSSGIAQREAEALGPLIRRIRDQLGCAVVVVEHDMPLLVGIADRLVAMESGAVVTTGVAAEVLAHPRVVEAYLGATREIIERSGDRGTEEEVVT